MATSIPSAAASAPVKSPQTSSNLSTLPPPLPASPPPTSPPPVILASPPLLVSASPPIPMSSPPPPSTSSPPPTLSALPPPPATVAPSPSPSPPTASSPPLTFQPPTPSNSSTSRQPPTATPSPPLNTPPSQNSQSPSNSSSAIPPPENYPSPRGNRSPPSPPTNSSSSLTPPQIPLAPPITTNGPQLIPHFRAPVGTSAAPSTPSKSSNQSLDINRPSGGGSINGVAVGITLAVSLVVFSILGLALWFARKRTKQVGRHVGGFVMPSLLGPSQISGSLYPRNSIASLSKSSSTSYLLQYSPSVKSIGNSKPCFTYEELSGATNGFSPQNLLGEGGFGRVYKGSISDGREVAVKQLKVGGGQGEREFSAEVETISHIHHRHLVSLVGYCISENQRLLVYDYVPNNTLYYHLHGKGAPVMNWSTRVKVAAGAARGITYLHEDCHPRIIHRDIKSSNILLDKNFEAQVSDFGLAKLALDADTHVSTRVMGTFGYLAPEYASTGKLTDKSDVYSFGVVLLELITGRKPIDSSQPLGNESLVEWGRPLLVRALETKDFKDLPDPRLKNNYSESEMFRMIDAAAACVRHSASRRPHMGQVARALECLSDSLDLHNGMKPGQSELFELAQESEEIRMFRKMAFGNQDRSSDFSFSFPSWRSQRD